MTAPPMPLERRRELLAVVEDIFQTLLDGGMSSAKIRKWTETALLVRADFAEVSTNSAERDVESLPEVFIPMIHARDDGEPYDDPSAWRAKHRIGCALAAARMGRLGHVVVRHTRAHAMGSNVRALRPLAYGPEGWHIAPVNIPWHAAGNIRAALAARPRVWVRWARDALHVFDAGAEWDHADWAEVRNLVGVAQAAGRISMGENPATLTWAFERALSEAAKAAASRRPLDPADPSAFAREEDR